MTLLRIKNFSKKLLVQFISISLLVFDVLQAKPLVNYRLDQTHLCDGLPKLLDVKTPEGFCLGLVDDGDLQNGTNLVLPRSLVQIDDDTFLLADQGSKNSLTFSGQIFLLKIQNGQAARSLLINAEHPAGFPKEAFVRIAHISKFANRIYFSTTRAIYSFIFKEGQVSDPRAEITNLQISTDEKALKSELHALKNFVFDQQGNIIVNIGSSTNVCRADVSQSKNTDCKERETRAQLRKYSRLPNDTYDQQYKVLAKGLRNSLALAINPNHPNWLFQAENSRDAIAKFNPRLDAKLLPNEELNFVDLNHKGVYDFGWPYCHSGNSNNPEYPMVNCKTRDVPLVLLPAHAAPLGMLFHTGSNWPEYYKNKLIMSLHGYEAAGHRLVVFSQDQDGKPESPMMNLVWNWGVEGGVPLGTPVQILETHDGSLLIVEDKNRAIWRLYFDPSRLSSTREAVEPQVSWEADLARTRNFYSQSTTDLSQREKNLTIRLKATPAPLFSKIQHELIDKYCVECHADNEHIRLSKYDDIGNASFLIKAKFVVPGKPENSSFLSVIENKSMPPSGLSESELQTLVPLIRDWINRGAPVPGQ